MKTDYEILLGRLKAVGCPYKLYPARLRALEVMTGERLLSQIAEVIAMRIVVAGAGDIGWKYQFQRDLETYGLLEAIGYFHSYPPLREEFVEDACCLYERLASMYLEYHEQIMASDDPRVVLQLEVLRAFGDSTEHVGPRMSQSLRRAPHGIAPGQRPRGASPYRRRLPVHRDLLELGLVGPVDNRADELIEHLAASFMFEGFPGVQAAFLDVARVLDDHGVEVFGSEGQYVLATLVTYLGEEMFGDFDRWIPCARCHRDFLVDVSLSSVNDSLLAGGWMCDRCRNERRQDRSG